MLIKTKLYGTGSTLCLLLVITSVLAVIFSKELSYRFQQVTEGAKESVKIAEKSAIGLTQGSKQLRIINNEMLNIVDGIGRGNQQARLVGKKIKEISETVNELNETIEEISEDVLEADMLDILQEISDEVSDIGERLRREALISIDDTSNKMNAFSSSIASQASQVSALNTSLEQQVQTSYIINENNNKIQSMAEQAMIEIGSNQKVLVSLLVAIAIFSVFALAVIVKATIIPINRTKILMQDIAEGEGDLTQRMKVIGKDEMTMIAGAFNLFVEKIQGVVVDANNSMHDLTKAADNTSSAMNEGTVALQNQQLEIEQIATAINEMSTSFQEVSRSAVEAATATSEAGDYANTGTSVVISSKQSVSLLAEEISNAVSVINSLSAKASDIQSVVTNIKNIAAQTNLLALNAAIEAARAGEQGRGFAVVADEVRSLAVKADESSSNIEDLIDEIQSLTNNAVGVMQSSQVKSNDCIKVTDAASLALAGIADSIKTINNMNTQIASAAEQQSAVSEEINERVVQVTSLSQDTSSAVANTVTTCDALRTISERLHMQLSHFKV